MPPANGRNRIWWLLAGLPFLIGWLGWLTEGSIRHRAQLQANDVFHVNMDRRVTPIQEWMREGRRFTGDDGDRHEAEMDGHGERIARLEQQIEDLRRQLRP